MEKPNASDLLTLLTTAARKAEFEVKTIGHVQDLPLLALERSVSSGSARIYLSAGIHADEPAGPVALCKLLESGFFHKNISWTICPLLNPAAWDLGTRENPDGIDLNRDYRNPRSEEIRIHRSWLKTQPPNDLFLSLHEDWEATGFYLYEINTASIPSLASAIVSQVATIIPPETMSRIDDHEVTAPGWIHHHPDADEPEHWPEAIFHLKMYPHLSYTFETPSCLDLETRANALGLAVQSAVNGFMKALQET